MDRRGVRRQHPALKPKDLQLHSSKTSEDSIDHLAARLFEAHGRDEAGWDEEAGHRDMWFAARRYCLDQRARTSH